MPPSPRSLFSAIRLQSAWERLRTSFWFVPALMAVATIALSFAMTRLDDIIDERVYRSWKVLPLFGPEGARAILSAIASSMITVAGLTFSITMLMLQLASSQFGPRLLRNFMRDRGNQVVLGTFISTFLYCLLVLRTVRGVEGASFVPHLSVAMGIGLAIASIAILIFFIHHTAHSIRIETLLAALASEIRTSIVRLYPERLGHDSQRSDRHVAPDFTGAEAIRPSKSGYVQSVDSDAMLDIARRHDLVLDIAARPGSFVTRQSCLMRVSGARSLPDDVAASLRATMVVGDERTPDQDLQFSIRRIVEIAQRSLSPGINDPTTALYCIDRLGDAFVELAGRSLPSPYRLDDDGQLRIVTETVDFDTLARSSFAAIARYAGDDDDVLEGLAVSLDRIIDAASPAQGACLAPLRQALRRELLRSAAG